MKRKVWVLIVILLMSGMVCVPAAAAVETDTPLTPGVKVVIAIDTSKSMTEIPFDSPDKNIVRSTLLLYELLDEIPGIAVKYSLFSSSTNSPQIRSHPYDDDFNLTDDEFHRLDETGTRAKQYAVEAYEVNDDRYTALVPGLTEVHDFIQEDMQENAGAEYAVVLITDFQTSEPKKEEAYQYADQLREMGASVVIISPQGPKQKRDDSFKNAFADRVGAVKTLDANNEQQLSKAYIDTFIQLASCYACYQPVFISPKALLYSPAGTDIPQIEPDEVDGDPDEQNAKSRGSDKTIIQDQSENNKAQQNEPVFIEYKYKHFNTPIVNTNLLIIMNFYAHQFEKLVMHQFIDVEEEERLTGMEYYIFSHQVDEGEASVAGKVMDLPNYTFTLYENKAANDATNEQTTQKENTPEINPEIYILEKLPVNLSVAVKQNGAGCERVLPNSLMEESSIAGEIADIKDRPDILIYKTLRSQPLTLSLYCDKEKERQASMNRMLKISFAETGHEKDNAQSSYTTELNPDENGAFTHVLTTEEIASLTEKEYTVSLELFEADEEGGLGDMVLTKTIYLIFEQNTPYFYRDLSGDYEFIKKSASEGELMIDFNAGAPVRYLITDVIRDDQQETYVLGIINDGDEQLKFSLDGNYLVIDKKWTFGKTFAFTRSNRNELGLVRLSVVEDDGDAGELTVNVLEKSKTDE